MISYLNCIYISIYYSTVVSHLHIILSHTLLQIYGYVLSQQIRSSKNASKKYNKSNTKSSARHVYVGCAPLAVRTKKYCRALYVLSKVKLFNFLILESIRYIIVIYSMSINVNSIICCVHTFHITKILMCISSIIT